MIIEENVLRLESIVIEYNHKHCFPIRKESVTRAINNVSFSLGKSSILGIVGESGCGKSSLLKAICKFIPIRSGRIFIDDIDVTSLSRKAFFPYRKKIQMIPQDFCDTFNPKMSVSEILAEPLDIHFPHLTTKEKNVRIVELLELVEMGNSLLKRLPMELSGGQRQRLSIARGLAVNPDILICDEIVSACDLFLQKQILSLLTFLNREKRIAILFISHNIAVVAHFCHNIIVMHHGELLELGTTTEICIRPKHSYTRLLIDAIPSIEQKEFTITESA